MTSACFHVFGMGAEYLEYIGWTERLLSEEKDIILDLIKSSDDEISSRLKQVAESSKIDIFEIESAPTIEDAKYSVEFWGQYYRMIGAKVNTASA
jgi:hypothetical protein